LVYREKTANPEELEYYKIQEELSHQLLDQFKQVERIIDARRTSEGSGQEYLCKWMGLPYAESTWEDGALISDLFQEEIDNFFYRNDSDCIPPRSAKVQYI
jgi:chromodomain-helicase-DNA-binding protein 1